MYCTKCGTEIPNIEGAQFCPKCGVQGQNIGMQPQVQAKKTTNTVLIVVGAVLGVILLLGTILAAIAIPQFREYKTKAFNSAAISDIRNAKTSCESYFVDNQRYPKSLSETEFKAAPDVVVNYKSDGETYQITSYHQKGTRTMKTTNDKLEILFKLKNEADDSYKPM